MENRLSPAARAAIRSRPRFHTARGRARGAAIPGRRGGCSFAETGTTQGAFVRHAVKIDVAGVAVHGAAPVQAGARGRRAQKIRCGTGASGSPCQRRPHGLRPRKLVPMGWPAPCFSAIRCSPAGVPCEPETWARPKREGGDAVLARAGRSDEQAEPAGNSALRTDVQARGSGRPTRPATVGGWARRPAGGRLAGSCPASARESASATGAQAGVASKPPSRLVWAG